MKCPYCYHEETKVTDSRTITDMNAIKRRRECHACGRRFTTFETVDPVIQVHKRDGSYEEFVQQKLIAGLDAACRHTSVSHSQVRTLADKITMELMDRHVKEISTKEIGEVVMEHLRALDQVAYIRFACVYRRFKDIHELKDAIDLVAGKESV